jgi:hypothetical protein
MEKHWFILKKDHHLGPLSPRRILELLDDGEIDENTLIWKKGEEDWLPLAHYPEILRENLAFDEEDIPPPPLSLVQLPQIPNIEEEIEIAEQAPLAKSDTKSTSLYTETDKDEFKKIRENLIEDVSPKKLFFSKPLKIVATLLLIVVAATPFYFFDLSFFETFKPLTARDLELEQIAKLNQVAQEKSLTKPELILNKLGNKIYLSSSLKGEYQVYLNLISMEGEVLSDQVVSISSQGKLENHFAVFDNFKIVSGESLKPGRYKYRLTLRKINFFGQSLDTNLQEQGQILMSKYAEEEFKEKLKKFHQLRQFNRNVPVHERIERYSTFMKTLETGYEQFQKILSTISSGKEIKAFQDYYVKNMGMILQDLILDNYSQAEKWQKENNEEKYNQYNDLFLYGKNIAGFFSESIETVEKKKGKLSAYDRGQIGNQTGEKFQVLLNFGTEKVKQFESELQ